MRVDLVLHTTSHTTTPAEPQAGRTDVLYESQPASPPCQHPCCQKMREKPQSIKTEILKQMKRPLNEVNKSRHKERDHERVEKCVAARVQGNEER